MALDIARRDGHKALVKIGPPGVAPVPRELSRVFLSYESQPQLRAVDPRIFTDRYFSACTSCRFCDDSCCQHGCEVDSSAHARIVEVAPLLEREMQVPQAEWFTGKWNHDADEPHGGQVTRTRVVNEFCVFLDRTDRGCRLHRLSLKLGRDYHSLKPRACSLFPLVCLDGVLQPGYELREERTLVCRDQGPSLYSGVRNELEHYFGPALVEELDAMARLAAAS